MCGHAQLHMNPVTLTCSEGRGSLLRSGLGIVHAGTCKGACVQARSWGYPSLPYLCAARATRRPPKACGLKLCTVFRLTAHDSHEPALLQAERTQCSVATPTEPLCARLVSLAPCAKPSTHCDCLWQASAALSGTKESTLYLTSSKVGRTTDDFLRSTRYVIPKYSLFRWSCTRSEYWRLLQ